MLTTQCGHHCGIKSNAEGSFVYEGHCNCPECHDGSHPDPGLKRADNGTVE